MSEDSTAVIQEPVEADYLLTIRVPFKSFDDGVARRIMNFGLDTYFPDRKFKGMDIDVKLQRLVTGAPPKGVPLK